MPLRDDQIRRYARHILLPDVGGTGQARLLAAGVHVGDATSPAATAALVYLIAAGVGALRPGDRSLVEDVGFLYERSDVGVPANVALARRAQALNPDVVVSEVASVQHTLRVGAGDPLEAGARAAAALIEEILA